MRRRWLLALAACFAASPACALLIRADRDDSEYLELATRYVSALWIEPAEAGAVLIAPEWILTHGSAAERLDRIQPRPRLRIGAREHEIEGVFVSPNKRLGLVHLKSAVKGVAPSPIYKAHDEGGKALIVVSRGATGTIGEAARREDKRSRAGVNTVDALSEILLVSNVKPPDEASDLQASAIAEDRGSPAYIENQDGVFVAGIAMPEGGAARVGESNHFVRVSTRSAWIERTMREVANQELKSLLGEF